MTTTYTNQLWIVQNRVDVITQWWCAPDNPSSRSPLIMPAIALAFNYYMTKRVLSALSAVVTRHEAEYGELDLGLPQARAHSTGLTANIGNLELGSPEERELPRPPLAQPAAAANFCRVSVTPEELVLDFGINTQTEPNSTEPVRVTNRLVMDFSTAKRAWKAFHKVISEYEQGHGEIELDWQKRRKR